MNLTNKYSKRFAGYLPEGYYHVVLKVQCENYENDEHNPVWDGCILGLDNKVIKPSPEGCPLIGSCFWNEGSSSYNYYKLTVYSTKDEESAIRFAEFFNNQSVESKFNFVEVGVKYWIEHDDSDFTLGILNTKLNSKYEGIDFAIFDEPKEEKKSNQTNIQKAAQSLIAKNAVKIKELEDELKSLRIVQQYLKKQR